MERKKKLRLIQLFLLSIGLFFLFFTYSNNYWSSSNKEIISKETREKISKELDKNEDIKGNIFYNIKYSGLDLAGNRYILKSKQAETTPANEELINMTGVEAIFYFKDGTVLNVKSKFGIYNNRSLDMLFDKDVNAVYGNSKLTAQKAEYSNSLGFLTITENVKVNDIKGNLFAEKLQFDIKNQTLDIVSSKNGRINANVNLN
jgi:hypothetical protein